MNLRALYIGESGPKTTSFHRFAAMRRIGVDAELVDPYAAMGKRFSRVISALRGSDRLGPPGDLLVLER